TFSNIMVLPRRPWIHSSPRAMTILHTTVSDCNRKNSGCDRQSLAMATVGGSAQKRPAAKTFRTDLRFIREVYRFRGLCPSLGAPFVWLPTTACPPLFMELGT